MSLPPDSLLSKTQLHALADGLLLGEPQAVERCIAFIVSETKGHWHGRARAMMARRLKHCELEAARRGALVECITGRLESGAFSEQFKDQLRLAMHLDAQTTLAACGRASASSKPHVRRYAAWVASIETTGSGA